MCSIFIADKRTDVSGIVIEPVLMSSPMLPRFDCEAIRRAEERACHSMVRFVVQFNVEVVDKWDRDWSMAMHSSTMMFWLWAACTSS